MFSKLINLNFLGNNVNYQILKVKTSYKKVSKHLNKINNHKNYTLLL